MVAKQKLGRSEWNGLVSLESQPDYMEIYLVLKWVEQFCHWHQQQAAFFPAYIRSYSDINNGLMFPSGSRTNMFQTDRKPSSSSASLTFNKFPSIENYALMGKRLPVYNFGLGK